MSGKGSMPLKRAEGGCTVKRNKVDVAVAQERGGSCSSKGVDCGRKLNV